MKVNEHLSVLFLLEKSKANANGLTPITVRLTIDGARAEFSLGQKILPLYWSQEQEGVHLGLGLFGSFFEKVGYSLEKPL